MFCNVFPLNRRVESTYAVRSGTAGNNIEGCAMDRRMSDDG